VTLIGNVQFHYREGSPMGKGSLLTWEGFVVKVSFESAVKKKFLASVSWA